MRDLLLILHVAAAVVLIGELLFASLWLRSAMSRGSEPGLLRYALATMQWTSKSFALPAILVNLLTGLGLIHVGGISMHSMWLATITLRNFMQAITHAYQREYLLEQNHFRKIFSVTGAKLSLCLGSSEILFGLLSIT